MNPTELSIHLHDLMAEHGAVAVLLAASDAAQFQSEAPDNGLPGWQSGAKRVAWERIAYRLREMVSRIRGRAVEMKAHHAYEAWVSRRRRVTRRGAPAPLP